MNTRYFEAVGKEIMLFQVSNMTQPVNHDGVN